METNFKGTHGEIVQNGKNGVHTKQGRCVALTYQTDGGEDRRKYDAQLITDAFNVRQQINVDLLELLKQRDDMLQALKEIKDWYYSDDIANDHLPIGKVEKLITKIEQK